MRPLATAPYASWLAMLPFAPGVIGALAMLSNPHSRPSMLQLCRRCYSNQACDLSTIPALLCKPLSLSLVIRLNLLLPPGGLGLI